MNDRFKFRVWDRKHNSYHPSDKWFVDRDGQLWFKGAIFESGSDEDFTIEQCTGVKDHQKTYIYEGDVVRMYIPCEDNHRLCVVEYQIDEEDTAQWLCRYLDGKRKHNTFGSTIEISAEYLSGAYCEIVGTIHDDQFRDLAELIERDKN